MISRVADAFIRWVIRRQQARRFLPTPIVTFEGKALFERYAFFRRDEWPDSRWNYYRSEYPKRPNALPWWLPFNMFLHSWHPEPGFEEDFHDHPRWSITVMLKGQIVERTPWGNRLLRPGSIVVRSRRAIHGFAHADGYDGEIWTLFIVGRRKHRQNTYAITAH